MSQITRPHPQSLCLPAPAKLNLFLHITGRRADGYHELQTLFQLLDYGDELVFTPRDTPELELAPELPGVPPESNLIIRAARLLQTHTGCTKGAHIHLTKRLPMGGGIGGGSSDAATTLLALNHLWQLHLSLDELADLGLRLGADVPVFVRGETAWAEGIGERLHPVALTSYWYLVIAPECQVSTKEIFSNQRLTRNTPKMTIAPALEGQGQTLRNDCQPIVAELYPEVDRALGWLSQYGTARLTGTGACVFASFDNETECRNVFSLLPATFKGFVARGINRSPVHNLLFRQTNSELQ